MESHLGYGNEPVKQAMHEQIDRLFFVNPLFFSESHGEALAERLCKLLPGEMERVFFTCTGSEAVEAAIKAARKYCENIGKPFPEYCGIRKFLSWLLLWFDVRFGI